MLAGALLIGACGSDQTSSGPRAPSATLETNDTTAQLDLGTPAEPPADGEPAPPDAAGDATPTNDPPPTDAAGDATPANDPPPTDAAGDATPDPPAEVQPAVLGGRAFEAAVAPASEVATNLLPDLVIDDVRRESKANFRNIFPADRPVLLWLWAPH